MPGASGHAHSPSLPRRYRPAVEYLVLARKYRPQTFADVSGQEVVSRTLANAIRKGKVAHAYLFTGPRGVGKTSMARILAKALCCEKGPTPEPCGTCTHCRMITDSTHPDVAEVDAARFGKVDDVRELLERAAFAPTLANLRIYILDEVHMLSTSSWNALLKILEEPPPHVRFIFATTEIDKVLPTVQSRSQRFDFRAISLASIAKRLGEICAKEGVAVGEPLLMRIARAAGGGMRDAQTLLDQLIAVGDQGVSEDDLDLLLGSARGSEIEALAAQLLAGKGSEALATLDRLCGDGVAPGTLLDQLVELLRTMLLVQSCGRDSLAVRRLGILTARIEELAGATTPERTLRACQVLVASQQTLRHGGDARLQVELACVRLASLSTLVDYDALLRRIERLETAPAPVPLRPR